MTVVSHRHELIFLKTRKTAGSSIEIWLAPFLDPETDLAAVTADLSHYRPDLAAELKPRGLKAHATAAEVRDLVGDRIWHGYYKFSVERDPWDRIISLWRWRQYSRQVDVSFDEFLEAIAQDSSERLRACGAEDWSNWPIYSIDDTVVLDDVILYEELYQSLPKSLACVGMEFDGRLVRTKSNIRKAEDTVDALTNAQVDLIAKVFEREIREFGFAPPGGRTYRAARS